MNINTNYIPCPKCKNIFLKTHISYHYKKCIESNNNNYNNRIKSNEYSSNNRIEQSRRVIASDKQFSVKQKNHENRVLVKEKSSHSEPKQVLYYASPHKQEQSYSSNHKLEQSSINRISNELSLEKYIPPHISNYNDSMLMHFFKKYNELFTQYVSGKYIALVGPAQSIIDTNKGDVIDKFDIIVRLNKSLPLPAGLKKDIGSRTDIVYNSLNTTDFPGENNLNPRLYKKYGVSFMCSSYPFNHQIFKQDILNYVYKYKFEIPLKVMEDSKFKNFENALHTRPFTGTCAIMDLLSYPIKYLYITGLDFYQTKYYSEYRHISKDRLKSTRNGTIHQSKPQLDYLKNISLFDDRIILDAYLDKLLYHDYYKIVKHLRAFDTKTIFKFGDTYFQKYFELKVSKCNMTTSDRNYFINKTDVPHLIITNNRRFNKGINEYILLITNNKDDLIGLNGYGGEKKFIGNFYYNENKSNPVSITLDFKFLSNLRNLVSKVGITNCNANLVIALSLMLYLPDKHFFSFHEIFNNWSLSMNEKKLVLFLHKKKLLILV